ncbi:MAG: glycosyltransferase family 4 protein [Roseococcus sp.]|nr:glycosyltransferase family 4 protein [Roseococcus sp.]
MHWKIVYPSQRGARMPWMTDHIPPARHDFELIPADYAHDRSRPRTDARQWLDYLRHAWRGWRAATRDPRQPVGIVTAFPQLPVFLGLFNRLTGGRRPILCWSFNLGRAYGGWRARLARAGLAGVGRLVVHSRREAESYAALLGLPRERFVFLPFSVRPLAPSLPEEEEAPFVLAMGTARRDYATLLRALARLGLPGVIVAGPHALEGLELPAHVTLRSNLTLEDCHALAQRARVNVVPVDNDSTASGQVTIVETMMLGRPVVATRCIGSEDYVTEGETGLLVPPRDAEALAAAILRLWEDAALRRRLGAAARAHALRHFTFEASAAPLAAELDRLARGE